jgi:hypothetical protein
MYNRKSNWKSNLLVLALALAATGAIASAQEITLIADVPFAFSVNNAHLTPGNYTVTHGANVWLVRNEDSPQAAAIVSVIALAGKATEKPSLTFSCVRTHCQMSAIHLGGGLGVALPLPELSKSDADELAVVTVPVEQNQGQ